MTCCTDSVCGEVSLPTHAMVPFILWTKHHHLSSPDRLEFYLCYDIHRTGWCGGTASLWRLIYRLLKPETQGSKEQLLLAQDH